MYVLDPDTSECLHYEPVVGYPPKAHVSIPREILAEHPEVEIRYDFIDCSIDVCSVEVRTFFASSSAIPAGRSTATAGSLAIPGQL